jgi:hypothetical protein
MRFFLGTHMPSWLEKPALAEVPLFVSHRRLRGYRRLPVACTDWALDSGGFTELSMHGAWVTSASDYVAAVRRYADDIGRLQWAAPQDWMCEPHMLAKTHLSVSDHQDRTIASVLELRHRWADGPFIAVLQGWDRDDYLRHVDKYESAGIDLAAEPVVGLGSVCRRQALAPISDIVASLAPLRLHGFGVKAQGLALYGDRLLSSDSMAWSYGGRRNGRCASAKTCANCMHYALWWRQRVLAALQGTPESGAARRASLEARFPRIKEFA